MIAVMVAVTIVVVTTLAPVSIRFASIFPPVAIGFASILPCVAISFMPIFASVTTLHHCRRRHPGPALTLTAEFLASLRRYVASLDPLIALFAECVAVVLAIVLPCFVPLHRRRRSTASLDTSLMLLARRRLMLLFVRRLRLMRLLM